MNPSEAGKLGYAKIGETLAAINQAKSAKARENWIPSGCLYCGEPIPYEKRGNKFCNHSCSASFSNQGTQRHKVKPGVNPDQKCLACGKDLNSVHRRYCNNQCQADDTMRKRATNINTTGVLTDGFQSEGRIRRYLLDIRPHECVICHNTEWLGDHIPLVMDHIDGNPDNWKIENVRLICPNCDAKTPTYKGKNRGHGRWKRRERYQSGLSF